VREQLATEAKVSARTISRAKAVKDYSPKLYAEVLAGCG
jgi:hypothetical protein